MWEKNVVLRGGRYLGKRGERDITGQVKNFQGSNPQSLGDPPTPETWEGEKNRMMVQEWNPGAKNRSRETPMALTRGGRVVQNGRFNGGEKGYRPKVGKKPGA